MKKYRKNLLVLGDDRINGTHYIKNTWTDYLQEYLNKRQFSIKVSNCGFKGDDTNKLLSKLECECSSKKPDIIIIGIGINDSAYFISENNAITPLKEFEKNLGIIIEKTMKFVDKNRIAFLGLANINEKKINSNSYNNLTYTNERINIYNLIIKSVCDKNRIVFIDLYNHFKNRPLFTKKDLEDGLYPNSKGYEKIFNNMLYHLLINGPLTNLH